MKINLEYYLRKTNRNCPKILIFLGNLLVNSIPKLRKMCHKNNLLLKLTNLRKPEKEL